MGVLGISDVRRLTGKGRAMGYTHYWERPAVIAPETFGRFAEDVRRIVTAVASEGVPMGDSMGNADSEPEIGDKLVAFNGVRNDGHESFYVPAVDDTSFNFCKTAQKPYDAAVVASLVALKHHVPATKLSSDGDMEDWGDGLALYRRVTGRATPLGLRD
jgi:hypothetical protein